MKTIIKIFICLSLIYTPMFANAANVGGWNLSNPVAKGASAVYDATKNVVINGKDFIKNSSVKITPTATQVAKTIGRTAGVIIAVEMLIGAIDWVLDPANNRVIYYEDPPPKELLPKLWVWDSRMDGKDGVATAEQACQKIAFTREQALQYGSYMYTVYKSVTLNYDGQDSALCIYDAYNTATGEKYDGNSTHIVTRKVNSAYNPEAEDERREKYLPYDAVAQQLISNASSGQPEAQAHTMAAAATEVAEAEKDDAKARPIANQADANAETKPADADAAASANTGAATATPQADPVTGEQAPPTDISLEFPVFCNWAPTICEAAQVVISFPQTLTGWWESANQKADDWATSISQAYDDFMRDDELPNDDTTLDISEIPTPELQENAISWGAACPADVSIPISMQGVSSTLVFSWGPWCQLLSIIKPAIIASAYIGAAFIVLGLRT